MRLDKLLAHTGFGTRSEVKRAIKNGWVNVNDKTVKDGGLIVDPQGDAVTWNGEVVRYQEYYYLMLHKPEGVLSATEDSRDQTVLDILPEEYLHLELFPVGRLDKDTTGLLLLTNDGALAHQLLSPKKKVPKRYRVWIDVPLTQEGIAQLEAGIPLEEDFVTSPAIVELLDESRCLLDLVIYEGRFHQVKRMMEHVGCTVTALKRMQMGTLLLDETLNPGDVRELTAKELEKHFGLVRE